MHRFCFAALAAVAAVAVFGFVSVAAAASQPAKARVYSPPPPVTVPTWTGFYIGAHIGGGFATSDWADTVPATVGLDDANLKPSGFLGGGQIGYNYQINNIVLGIEGEGTWANLTNSVSGCFQDATQTCTTKANEFATVTGRVGITWYRALLYAKGGAAWGHFKYENPDPVFGPSPDYFASDTRSGWIVGGGIEYALNNNWSVKLEYDYLDFGASTLTFTGIAGDTFTETITDRVQMVKFGANYLFR
jgi:outer membrane immunogenic protein